MKRILFIFIILIFGTYLYGHYVEPYKLKTNSYIISSKNISKGFDGLKIIHFSDYLYKNNKDLEILKKTVNEINNLNPDIVVFTGDLLNKKVNDTEKKEINNLLNKINATMGKYSIIGDHDKDYSKDMLIKSGFTILDNEKTYLFSNDNNPILLIGANEFNDKLYESEYPYNYSIILTHKPDNFDKINIKSESLILAGHSLNGEIYLPFYGSVIRQNGAKKYSNNYYGKDNKSMYVSNGLGNQNYKIRLFNTPSINIYRLMSK